jgi:hypothetical protein
MSTFIKTPQYSVGLLEAWCLILQNFKNFAIIILIIAKCMPHFGIMARIFAEATARGEVSVASKLLAAVFIPPVKALMEVVANLD